MGVIYAYINWCTRQFVPQNKRIITNSPKLLVKQLPGSFHFLKLIYHNNYEYVCSRALVTFSIIKYVAIASGHILQIGKHEPS